MKNLLLIITLFLFGTDANTQNCLNFWVDISPNGQYIYFSSNRTDGIYHIFKSNIDGTGLQQLTNNSIPDFLPTINPDGNKIAFQRGNYGPSSEIFIMDDDGLNVTQLTSNTTHDGSPNFSPDGLNIVFDAWDGSNYPEVFRMNVDGTGRTMITNVGGAYWNSTPKYLPDGSKIYYRYGINANNNIRSMNPDGTGIVDITPPNAFGFDDFGFDFNSDGSKMSFSTSEWLGYNNGFDIVIANSDGTNWEKISNATAGDYYYSTAFHPNDGDVYFTYQPSGSLSSQINKMMVDGSNQTQITDCAPPMVYNTVIEGSAVQDAEVYSYSYRNWFNADWGANEGIPIGNYSGLDRRAYFKFDLSTIPTDANITSASFELYYSGWAHSCNTSVGVTIHRIEDNGYGNWIEGNGVAVSGITEPTAAYPVMTWNNQSKVLISNTDVISGPPLTSPPQTLTYDLSTFVQNWVSGTWDNYGFMIERDNAESTCWQYIRTSESTNSPRLIITWEEDTFEPFITTWQTDNPGTSNSNSITIPTYPTETYNYDVDWDNDGVFDEFGLTGDATHDYVTDGTYQVAIQGDFPRIYFNNNGDKEKILSIDQWGTNEWTSMNNAFSGCQNLLYNATDTPDLTGVSDMSYMFYRASVFTGDLNSWDVSNVIDMSFMFAGSYSIKNSFNGNISSWNVEKVGNMKSMFFSSLFNNDISSWNVGNVTNMDGMFYYSTFNGDVSSWDVSNVTDMSSMFREITNFNSDLSTWDVGEVTDMAYMFYKSSQFNSDVSNWDVSNVINMGSMFREAVNFNSDLSNWNVANVTDFSYLFYNVSGFNSDLSNWNTSSATDLSFMFSRAILFNRDIGNWNVSNVTNLRAIFWEADAFNQNLANWNVSNVINMSWAFREAESFNQNLATWNITSIDLSISGWSWAKGMVAMLDNTSIDLENYDNTLIGWANQSVPSGIDLGSSGLNYCNGMAARTSLINDQGWIISGDSQDCSSFLPLHFVTTWKTDNPGTSNSSSITIPSSGAGYNYDVDWDNDGAFDEFGVTGDVSHDFGVAGNYTIRIRGDFPRIYFNGGGDRLKILSVDQWGNIQWSSMAYAFKGAENLKCFTPDAPDLSQVTSLSGMFVNAIHFEGDLMNWDVSTITDMLNLFSHCYDFTSDISNWDVSNVTLFGAMFSVAESFNVDISNWNVSSGVNFGSMFDRAISFNQDIGNWNMVSANILENMFRGATLFNQDISGWNVSNITDMRQMFITAPLFNQDLSLWDVSNVTDMRGMFQNATSFDQNLGSWNISNVSILDDMLKNSGLSLENYDNTLIGWATQSVQPNANLGALGLSYCDGDDARDDLINNHGWTITGDIDACPNEPPIAVCQSIVVNANSNCEGMASASDFDGGSSDLDGDVMTFSIYPEGPYPLGETSVILTVSDPENESSSCSATITVNDNEAPDIICAPDQTQTADLGECGAVVTVVGPTVDDNCLDPLQNGLNFDGVDDQVSVPHTSELNPDMGSFTWEAWIKTDNGMTGDYQVIVEKYGLPYSSLAQQSIVIWKNTGQAVFQLRDNNKVTQNAYSTTIVTDNEWHHIAIVLDRVTQQQIIYIDGVEEHNRSFTSSVPINSIAPLTMGWDVYGRQFNGTMDEVRIWNVARSALEIQNSMNVELSGNESGLVSYYNFNQGVAGGNNSGETTLLDQGASNNGSLNSFALSGNASNWISGLDNSNLTILNNFNNTADASGDYQVGTTTVIWTVTDEAGNENTCTQDITVTDNEAPIADIDPLPDATEECSVTLTVPTATDNCEGLILGTTSDPLTYTEQGTYTVTWTYDDGNGNTSQQTQTVLVEDVTPPEADVDPLPILDGECEVVLTAPTATDNCEGAITVTTTDPTSYNGQGTYTVTWTYDDGNGNTSQQTQTVVVDDVTPPIADVDPLPNTEGECEVVLTAPTATDNCEGAITATTTDPTSYNGQGIYNVTWTYDDGNGNTSQQTQTVVVDDVTYPEFDILCPADIILCGSQSVNWIEPTATDNCSIAYVFASHTPSEVFEVGTTTVTYEFTDIGDNMISCGFEIIINPLPDISIVQQTVPDFCQGLTLLEVVIDNESDLASPISFSWSDNLGTEAELIVALSGMYEVTVIDGNGCASIATIDVNDNPADALSAYVMIGFKEVSLQETNVYSGGVGVIQSGKKAKVKQNSIVSDFVKAPEINKDGSSTIGTEIEAPVDIVLPPFYSFEMNDCEAPNIDVDENQIITLSGMLYNEIDVDDGGTVIFDAPEVYVGKIKTDDDVTFEFLQSTNIMVDSDMKFSKNNTITSNGHTVTFYVGKKAEFKEGADVNANIYAQEDIKVMGKSNNISQMTGLFISMDKIKSEKYVDWYPNDICEPAMLMNYPLACSDDDADSDFIENEISFSRLNYDSDMQLYPNPTRGNFNLKFNAENSSDIRIIVYDIFGSVKKVIKKGAQKGENTIALNLDQLISGTYIVKLIGSDKDYYKTLELIK